MFSEDSARSPRPSTTFIPQSPTVTTCASTQSLFLDTGKTVQFPKRSPKLQSSSVSLTRCSWTTSPTFSSLPPTPLPPLPPFAFSRMPPSPRLPPSSSRLYFAILLRSFALCGTVKTKSLPLRFSFRFGCHTTRFDLTLQYVFRPSPLFIFSFVEASHTLFRQRHQCGPLRTHRHHRGFARAWRVRVLRLHLA